MKISIHFIRCVSVMFRVAKWCFIAQGPVITPLSRYDLNKVESDAKTLNHHQKCRLQHHRWLTWRLTIPMCLQSPFSRGSIPFLFVLLVYEYIMFGHSPFAYRSNPKYFHTLISFQISIYKKNVNKFISFPLLMCLNIAR